MELLVKGDHHVPLVFKGRCCVCNSFPQALRAEVVDQLKYCPHESDLVALMDCPECKGKGCVPFVRSRGYYHS